MKRLLLLGVFIKVVFAKCPNGDTIVRRGIDDDVKEDILYWHNKYRQDVMDGEVPYQPKGVDLLPLEWNDFLTANAQYATSFCGFANGVGDEASWPKIGQNILKHLTHRDAQADWESAIFEWFYEYKTYQYPGNERKSLNYEQIVRANTTYIGCDHLEFRSEKTEYLYHSLYICNYASGGNINGTPPYFLA